MSKIQVIIVDDEALGRDRIRRFVDATDDLTIVAQCDCGTDAVEAIQQLSPDLVFLDIQMPDLDGFGVIEALHDAMENLPAIIFVTAYDQHAIKAFEINALDYLLKPANEARFQRAVDRIRSRKTHSDHQEVQDQIAQLISGTSKKAASSYIQRIEVKTGERVDYIKVETIRWFEADGNYLELHTQPKTHLARMTMGELEEALDPSHYIRISRSAVVNLAAVESIKLLGRREHVVVLSSGEELPITRGLTRIRQRLQFPS